MSDESDPKENGGSDEAGDSHGTEPHTGDDAPEAADGSRDVSEERPDSEPGSDTPNDERRETGRRESDSTGGESESEDGGSDPSDDEAESTGDEAESGDDGSERIGSEADSTDDEIESDDGETDSTDGETEAPELDISDDELASDRVTVGDYTWEDCERDVFWEDGGPPTNWRGKPYPFEPEEYLGFDPDETDDRVDTAAETAAGLSDYFESFLDPEETPVELGEYLWEHFRYEYYYERDEDGEGGREISRPRDDDGEIIYFDRSEWVGHEDLGASVFENATAATDLSADFEDWLDPATTPVVKGDYYWEHFKYEYYYEDTNVTAPERPRDEDGEIERFDDEEWLGFPEDDLEDLLAEGAAKADELLQVEDERTLDVPEELDEDEFFSTVEGHTTLVNRYDLEKQVPLPKKQHFREVDRYWVNKPVSFVVIFHSEKENETKYYLMEPYCTPIETDLKEFLTGKLRTSIKYSSDDVVVEAEEEERGEVIERETRRLLARYDLYEENDGERAEQLADLLARYDDARDAITEYVARAREETDAALEPVRESYAEYAERRRKDDSGDPEGESGDGEDIESADGPESGDDSAASEPTPNADGEDEIAADGGEPSRSDRGFRREAKRTDGGTVDDGGTGDDETVTAPASPDELASPDDPKTTGDAEIPDPPATADAETNLPETTDEDADPRIRLDEYLDLDFEAEGSLRQQVRAAIEAKIEALEPDESGGLDGISVRPEPALLEEDDDTLSEYQTEKLLYLLRRDFIGYERIDGIKHDINVEDISVDGYNSPVFVYHTDYEQIITNVFHGETELDDFVVKLAQRSGKGISKRQPQVDATLPDGSRAQLTLGREVSDHGTNYTIRQFKDVPFTPIDLVNWNTFSLEEMAFLWLAIENHKSLIFAGGTASGKTTSLNAVSLFIPSNTKIVSIEDTREVELPQRNWIASVTRPSFSDDDKGDVDEFDLLEAALRQRPDYIVMGEIRGEEGRTLFQVMSTGHTTYTTFHADTVGEVLKRFTTEPINVSKTLFTALDLVSIQTQTRVQGSKVRRNKSLTEINHYDPENDEINVQDIFQWRAENDEFMRLSGSNTMEDIMFDRGWDHERLEDEILKRRVILAYLIRNGLNEYTQVAATAQAFINDPDTILTLIANGRLEESLEDLREMESVHIDIDPKKEEMVPRPDPDSETFELAKGILAEAEDRILDDYRGADASVDGLAIALSDGNRPDADGSPSGSNDDAPDPFADLAADADVSLDDVLGPDAEGTQTGFDAEGNVRTDADGDAPSSSDVRGDDDASGDERVEADDGTESADDESFGAFEAAFEGSDADELIDGDESDDEEGGDGKSDAEPSDADERGEGRR